MAKLSDIEKSELENSMNDIDNIIQRLGKVNVNFDYVKSEMNRIRTEIILILNMNE